MPDDRIAEVAEPATSMIRLDPDNPGVYIDADGLRVCNPETITALRERDQARDDLRSARRALTVALAERDSARHQHDQARADLARVSATEGTRRLLAELTDAGNVIDLAHAALRRAGHGDLTASLADRVDALTAERDAARPVIDAARHWHAVRADRTTLGGTYIRACQALADAVAALPPSLGSPPARAQEGYPVSADAALHTCGALDGNGRICVGWEHDEATAHDWQPLPAGHAGRSADGHASGDHSGCTPGLCGYAAAEMLRPRKPTPVELRLAELEHRLGRLEDRVDEMRLEPEYDPADDAQGTAAPAEAAAQPPARPADGHRQGDSVTEAHRGAETVGYEIVATRLHRDGLGALVSGDVVASAVSARPTLAEAIDELRSTLGPAEQAEG